MGQMTVGVMYGAHRHKAERMGDLMEQWPDKRGQHLGWDDGGDVVGYFVGVGGESGRECGAADIGDAVTLDAIPVSARYGAAYRRAVRNWEAFAEWCATQGVVLPAPQLWLVTTEVA